MTQNIFDFIQQQTPIIDCRNRDEFENRHLQHSANIPVNELFGCMQELPKKNISFVVIFDKNSKDAEAFFQQRQFLVEAYFHWHDVESLPDEYFATGKSRVHFWQPAPFVKKLHHDYLSQLSLPSNKLLDLACGSGRDAIYLASQGWSLYGLDYSETAIERCKHSARNHQVSVQLACVDLEKNFDRSRLDEFPQQFACILVCRYLHRPLFDTLKQWLEPGGVIAYQTFMLGSEKIGSPRNPNFLLKPGELADVFSSFNILTDETEWLDDGRPLSCFIAQKPIVESSTFSKKGPL